jgi:prepilin-type N-terminal cleavage/methylation domain-containing protein
MVFLVSDSARARLKRGRGFTLVELMMTVAMLAVLAVVTLPPVLRALQRREAVNAAQAVIDFVEFGKTQAASRNRGYQLTWTYTATPETNGKLTLKEADSTACFTFVETPADIRVLDLKAEFPTVHLKEVRPWGTGAGAICLKPDGRVLDASSSLPIQASDPGSRYGAGDAVFVLQRASAAGYEGQKHVVHLPFNGAARVAFEP